jgi:2-polyprenyl-3-methyl-5-hydroxy-6-metoxy-1,4-benzoquinol methylase
MGDYVHCGTISSLGAGNRKFDVITVSHVLEHLYDVDGFLQECFRLLNKGGELYIEYPNPESYLCEIFQDSWRGLEPPRHISLPSYDALKDILYRRGFAITARYSSTSAASYMLSQSLTLAALTNTKTSRQLDLKKIMHVIRSTTYRENLAQQEFITIKATPK